MRLPKIRNFFTQNNKKTSTKKKCFLKARSKASVNAFGEYDRRAALHGFLIFCFYNKAFSDIFYLKIAGFLRFLVIDGTTLRSKIVHALKLVIF